MATITLRVKPAVFRWIDNNFPKVKGAYDVRKTFLHDMVVAALSRSNHVCNNSADKRIATFRTVRLRINGRWLERFGTVLSDESIVRLNQALYNLLINEICNSVMHAHVLTDYPKNTMLKKYLSNLLYKENELSLSCISKIYQRKYLWKEKKMRQNFQ